jgi:hypothetical protein
MRQLFAPCIAAFAVIYAGAYRSPSHESPRRAYVQWVGADSEHPEPGFVLARDDYAWSSLWAAHTGRSIVEVHGARHGAPKIDFTTCMVVARFHGPATNQDGEVLTSLEVGDDALRLRFESTTFQTHVRDGPKRPVRTRPYGIWVVPRVDTPIVIEHRAAGLKSDPVRWVEVHRFPRR